MRISGVATVPVTPQSSPATGESRTAQAKPPVGTLMSAPAVPSP